MAVKQLCVTVSRYKQNDDTTMRELTEDVDVLMIAGKPEYCQISPKSGDPLILRASDVITAIRHVSNAEEK